MPDPDPNFPYGSHAEAKQTRTAVNRAPVIADDNMLGVGELGDVDGGFHPPKVPYPKVAAAGAAGALATVLVFLAPLAGIEVPAEVAAALTTLSAFAAAYLRTE